MGDLSATYDALAEASQIQAENGSVKPVCCVDGRAGSYWQCAMVQLCAKVLRIDQERFIAEVDPALFENVQTILNELNGTFKGQGYFTEPDSDLLLHVRNIPPQYGGSQNISKMITLKKDYEQGDMQLTMSFIVVAGRAVHLLDCDLDENRNIVLHSLDMAKHLFSGGTSPVSMHEYIVEDSAQNSATGISTVDLGYQLV